MDNRNQVFVMIRPVGAWIRAAERAAAAGAKVCLESFGFEDQLPEIWEDGVSRLGSAIFAMACKNFNTAKLVQSLAAGAESSTSHPVRVIVPWSRVTRAQAEELASLNPIPKLGSIRDVEQAMESPWQQGDSPSLVIEGYEAGGLCGSDSQYILIQKALSCLKSHTLIVAGPLGLLSFSALNSQGVRSILLDEQTLLLQDSNLPAATKQLLSRANGRQSIVLRSSEDGAGEVRCITLPGKGGPNYLFGSSIEASPLSELAAWKSRWMFPIGEGIDLAKEFATQYRTLGRLVNAYRTIKVSSSAASRQPKTIATQFGVQYPIIQGPMSRVSDNAEFAASVARGGALPTIAAAMMTAEALDKVLINTSKLIPDRPWGVGLLGFINSAHLQSQIAVLKRSDASFCILAGGTPAQAKEIASQTLRVFIHAPTPELLGLFIKEGWRDFILEGRECGGHIGPLSSLNLWERSIKVVLNQSSAVSREVCLVLAGGIHDEASAAFAAYMVDDLVKAGATCGLLVGSAYLATREIVADQAITQTYQQVSLDCTNTVFLETSPGHQSRCADTDFSREFNAKRDQLVQDQVPVREISNELDGLILGRLRLASKGLKRDGGGLVKVTEEDQLKLGMYMLGEAVCLMDRQTSIHQLHENIKAGLETPAQQAKAAIAERAQGGSNHGEYRGQEDIAIIGLSCKLPGANNPEQFWDLITRSREQIKEIPEERWSIKDFYSADSKETNKIHSKWGGFLDAVQFDPIEFGIPPQSLASIDPAQLLALVCVKEALQDAGYPEESLFDRDSTCVILGYSGGLGELGQGYVMQSELAPLLHHHEQIDSLLPTWTSDSFAGILPNVSAGRVANRFNLGGTNCTVDAACASSLAALDVAVHKLRKGEVNMAVVGAIDTLQSPFAYFCFSETQALSPTGKAKSFTSEADGIVLGEGAGIMILKRLEDAEASGDTIQAVIKGIGSSSDGRGRTMTAPSHQGQVQAFSRAYADAGVNPATLGFYEAHGTGTPVGDRSEIQALTTFLEAQNDPSVHCAVGSVKTLIGHTKSTAGLAGLLKATLALKNKAIPVHSRTKAHIKEVVHSETVYLPTGNHPWLVAEEGQPRTAGVSAFGFGGTNFHVVLQEYVSKESDGQPASFYQPKLTSGYRLLLFTAEPGQLLSRIKMVLTEARQMEEECSANGLTTSVNQIVADTVTSQDLTTHQFEGAGEWVIILSDNSKADLGDKLETVANLLEGKERHAEFMREWLVCHLTSAGMPIEAKRPEQIALLFPGQGSDYGGMGATCMAAAPLQTHELLKQLIPDAKTRAEVVDHYMFGTSDTKHGPPAELKQSLLAITELAYLELVNHLEIPWSVGLGHSLGDFVSLYATGWLSAAELVELLRSRGEAIHGFGQAGYGMSILFCTEALARDVLKKSQSQSVTLANINSPAQVVLSGLNSELESIETLCLRDGIATQRMQSNHPFHSSLMGECNERFKQSLAAVRFGNNQPCGRQFILSTSPRSSDIDSKTIQELLGTHMVSSVDFIASVQRAEETGCCFFIEVGPKKVLSKLVRSTLSGTDSMAVSLDGLQGVDDLLGSLMRIASHGVPLSWSKLNAMLQHQDSAPSTRAAAGKKKTTGFNYFINGAHAWKSLEKAKQRAQHDVHHAVSVTTSRHSVTTVVEDTHAPVMLTSVQSSPNQLTLASMNQPTSSSNIRLEAFRTYHETLRMMINSQTQVFSAFLNGAAPGGQETLAASTMLLPEHQLNGHGIQSEPISAIASPPLTLSNPYPQPTGQQQPTPSLAAAPQESGNGGMPIQPTTPLATIPQPLTPSTPVAPPTPTAPLNGNGNGTSAELKSVPTGLDAATVLIQLTSLLSEKSGYPVELLDADQDLESDLGIDSIKRIEVMGGFMATLSDVAPEAIQSIQTGTRDLRTLREVSAHIALILNGDQPNVSPTPAEVIQPGK